MLTNIYEVWSLPREEKNKPYRIQTEVVVYFFDAEWNNAWGECLGQPAYLPIADCPVPLKAGQRVSIDGWVQPLRERFIWDKTRVRVVEESVVRNAEKVASLGDNPNGLKGHLISVEGLVDSLMEDPTHVALGLLTGDVTANAYVVKGAGAPPLHFKAGDFVRLTCVCSPQFDRNGNVSDLSLFIGRLADIEVIGSLEQDARFDAPLTAIQEIQADLPTNNLLHVEGMVRSHEPGKWLTIWDATGQVMIQSRQTQPLRFGDRVEAVGYPYVVAVQQCLRGGFYRLSSSTNRLPLSPSDVSESTPLQLAERIRDLNRDEARRLLPVRLRAIVTWSHPQTPFAYVQDASGGIRVANPRWPEADTSKPGTMVIVQGQVAEGDFVPIVTNAIINRISYWNLDDTPRVTLEEALTGVHDGRWVEMRGFVRQVAGASGLVRLNLTTSSGEFEAWTPASRSYDSWKGSLIRVQGVCAAICNARHQLTGVQIWAPEVKYLRIEEAAPDNLFAVPLRPLGSLRRFNSQNALNQRVRTLGTVVLHVPGSYLYVQDGADSIFALSQQQDVLRPGDRVEVVGFPGNQGVRFVLREAVYRRIASGAEPAPVRLPERVAANADLEGRLASAEGTLLNVVSKQGETRLLIRSGDSTFEAILDTGTSPAREVARMPEFGSRLDLAGVYEVQSDEYGRPRAFQLHLRSWNDVKVLQRPPWWTLARLVWVLVSVLAISFVALSWGVMLSRKNRLLKQAQGALQAAHDKLELRVQERTRELEEKVLAEARARAELADAQKRLMQASRQAGMAEVATGVLHNVGNVLNSINVSTEILRDRLNQSSVGSMDKVAALFHEHESDLAQYLTQEQRGKKLVQYVAALGQHLNLERRKMFEEVEALGRNVDHIKQIVTMQQSYAQTSGVSEVLEPRELIEDALRLHAAAYERHGVEVVREFSDAPAITVDRHKTLQILTNIFQNAKYACDANAGGNRQVTVRLGQSQPDRVRIEIADNGMGIAPENLTRIFSFGFTTRKEGHGFGLHSGALAAKEMGGTLTARSEGVGKGATFILELPLNGKQSSS